jgi:curved DNA-binding protein
VRSGSRVRLSGQGSPGAAGGSAGDLYLLIEIVPHARFERDGDNLSCDVSIDIFTAAAGGEVRLMTLDGAVSMKIPPRTQAGKSFRLRGKGMPQLGHSSERGDLYARVKLVLPEPLRDDELAALRTLAQARQAQVR